MANNVSQPVADDILTHLFTIDPTLRMITVQNGSVFQNPIFAPKVTLNVSTQTHVDFLGSINEAYNGTPIWVTGLTTGQSGRTVNPTDKLFGIINTEEAGNYELIPMQADQVFVNETQDKKIAALQQGIINQTPYAWHVQNANTALPNVADLYSNYGVAKQTLIDGGKDYATFKLQAYETNSDEVGQIVTWTVPNYTDMGGTAISGATEPVFNGQYVFATFRLSDDSLAGLYFDKNTDVKAADKTAQNLGAVRIKAIGDTFNTNDLLDWIDTKGYIDEHTKDGLRAILDALGSSTDVDINVGDYDTDNLGSMAGALTNALGQLRQFALDRINDTATSGTDVTWSIDKIKFELNAQAISLQAYADAAAGQALTDANIYTDQAIDALSIETLSQPFMFRGLFLSNTVTGKLAVPTHMDLRSVQETFTYNPAQLDKGAVSYVGDLKYNDDDTAQFTDTNVKAFITRSLVQAEVTNGGTRPHKVINGIVFGTQPIELHFAVESIMLDASSYPFGIVLSTGTGKKIKADRSGFETAINGEMVANIKKVNFQPTAATADAYQAALQTAIQSDDTARRMLGEHVKVEVTNAGVLTFKYVNSDAVLELGN